MESETEQRQKQQNNTRYTYNTIRQKIQYMK